MTARPAPRLPELDPADREWADRSGAHDRWAARGGFLFEAISNTPLSISASDFARLAPDSPVRPLCAYAGNAALNDAAADAIDWPDDFLEPTPVHAASPPIPDDAPAPPVEWGDDGEGDGGGVTGVAGLIFAAFLVAYVALHILGVIPAPRF